MTTKTLGELILTNFDAARPILEAWARGERLECGDGTPKLSHKDTIYSNIPYRIPPRPSTVDWSQVGKDIVAFRTAQDGWHIAVCKSGHYYNASLFPSFVPGTMPWQDSKITRPEGV